jgi:hypothetical protein
MQNDMDTIKAIMNDAGIFPKVETEECIKVLKDTGPCPKECKSFNDCSFFVAMVIDFYGAMNNLVDMPDGFMPHLMNCIEMHKAGIKVELTPTKDFLV